MPHASLSFIIVAHNAASYLQQTVTDALLLLGDTHTDYEVILVDNASDDHTLTVMHELAAAHPPVLVVRLPHRHSRAAAFWLGMQHAHGAWVLTYDPTSAIGLSELLRLLHFRATADVVVAYRHDLPGSVRQRRAHARAQQVLNSLAAAPLRDAGNQSVLLRSALLAGYHARVTGNLLPAELVQVAHFRGATMHEAAVHCYRQPTATSEMPALLTLGDAVAVPRLLAGLRVAAHVQPLPPDQVPHKNVAPLRQWTRRVLVALAATIVGRSAWMLLRRAPRRPATSHRRSSY